jgi:CSLREA domain-containing protein
MTGGSRRQRFIWALIASAALMLALAASASADTVQVNTTVDEDDVPPNASCSLREAIFTVNGGADVGGCTLQMATGTDTITFDPAILTGAGPETIDLAAFGQLVIDTNDDSPVEIQGPGSGELTVTNTSDNDRIFSLPDGDESHTISGLELTDGDLVDPVLQLGAGIFSSSALTLDDVALRDNTTAPTGTPDGPVGAQGGGIFSQNELTIRNSVIEDNIATAVNADDDVTEVVANGGGIWHDTDAPLTIENSTVRGNAVITDDTSAAGAGFNEAVGGGIFAAFNVTISQSTLSGNSAEGASAAADTQAKGGAIRLGGLDSRIELSTIEGNTVVASGTGPPERGAGVMVIDDPNMPLVSSTIAGNGDATIDTDGANLFAEGLGGVALTNTIIASPVGVTGATTNCLEDTADNITSGGFNLDFEPGALTSSCNLVEPPTGTDLFGEDPTLGALADNGGFGETMLPQPGSPAIDQGSAGDQSITDEDQRELERPSFFDNISNAPSGDGSDIGAVEIQIEPPTFIATDPVSPNADTTPNVLGAVPTADGVDPLVVRLFANAACTVAAGVPSSPGVFASPGIATGPFAAGTTTTFHGTIESDYGFSHCSTGAFPNTITYTVPGPPQPPPVLTPPPSGTTPPPPKKCKKGFVKKRGKCVRKKRKKKGAK